MNKDKKLYKIKNKLGTFYIVAETFDEAANELKARLDQADYGFFEYRDIPAIEHVATQSFYNNKLKQSFSDSKPNLIISGSEHEQLTGVTATTGAYMIAVERERQVKDEGYGAEHDQVHAPMTLARAAVSYILCNDEKKRKIAKTTYWPWEDKYYKPRDMKRNLIRAGALVAAAIDRLLADDVQPSEPCDKCPDEVFPGETETV